MRTRRLHPARRALLPLARWRRRVAACVLGARRGRAAPVVTVDVAPVLNAEIQRTIRAEPLIYPLQQAAIVPKIAAPVKTLYVERGDPRARRASCSWSSKTRISAAHAAGERSAAYELAEATYETTARATVPAGSAESRARRPRGEGRARRAAGRLRQPPAALQGGRDRAEGRQRRAGQPEPGAQPIRNRAQAPRRPAGIRHATGAQGRRRAARSGARAGATPPQAQLGYSRITSPIDGVVTDRPVYPGETPPSGTPVVTVMDLSQVDRARARGAQRGGRAEGGRRREHHRRRRRRRSPAR